MARTKDYKKYPDEFFDIFFKLEEKVKEMGKENVPPLVLIFKDSREAASFRLDLYSFRSAVEKDEVAIKDLFPNCPFIVVKFPKPNTLSVEMRDSQEYLPEVQKAIKNW